MGLRSLTLATSPVPITSMGENEDPAITNRMKRHSVMVPSVSPVVTPARRASLNLEGSFPSPGSFHKIPTFKKYDLFKFYFFMLLLQCYV